MNTLEKVACISQFLTKKNRPSTFKVKINSDALKSLNVDPAAPEFVHLLNEGLWEWIAPNLEIVEPPWDCIDVDHLKIGEWGDQHYLVVRLKDYSLWAVDEILKNTFYVAESFKDFLVVLAVYEDFIEESLRGNSEAYKENQFENLYLDQLERKLREVDSHLMQSNSFWWNQLEWHRSKSRIHWFFRK